MMRICSVLVAVTLFGALVSEEAVAGKKRPRQGVFGTIHGKRFSASNLEGVADPCARGIYNPNQGIVTFAALECRAKRRRQGAVRKNYKSLVISCTRLDGTLDVPVVPYTIPCAASVYAETKTGRFGQPVSMTQWSASLDLSNPTAATSPLMMRIDAFDGTNLRGVLTGRFDTPVGSGASGSADVSGEVTFDLPLEVR
jgi:hypothetical protein